MNAGETGANYEVGLDEQSGSSSLSSASKRVDGQSKSIGSEPVSSALVGGPQVALQ